MYDRPAPVFLSGSHFFSILQKSITPAYAGRSSRKTPSRSVFSAGGISRFLPPYRIRSLGERRGKRFCTRNLQKIPALRSVGEVEDSREALPPAPALERVDAPRLLVAVQPPEAVRFIIHLPEGAVLQIEVVQIRHKVPEAAVDGVGKEGSSPAPASHPTP